jgi:hypothetical protein
MDRQKESLALASALLAEFDQVTLVLARAISCRVAADHERPRCQDRLDEAVSCLSIGLIKQLIEGVPHRT